MFMKSILLTLLAIHQHRRVCMDRKILDIFDVNTTVHIATSLLIIINLNSYYVKQILLPKEFAKSLISYEISYKKIAINYKTQFFRISQFYYFNKTKK